MKRAAFALTLLLTACDPPGSSCRTYAPESACVGGVITSVWCGDTGFVEGGTPKYTACGDNAPGKACFVEGGTCPATDGGSTDGGH